MKMYAQLNICIIVKSKKLINVNYYCKLDYCIKQEFLEFNNFERFGFSLYHIMCMYCLRSVDVCQTLN